MQATVARTGRADLGTLSGQANGHAGPVAQTYHVHADGSEEKLPGVVERRLQPGEWVRGVDCGGGGYGSPLERDPARVCRDVLERWETAARAREVYGVILNGAVQDESLAVDVEATRRQRARLASA